MSINEDLHEVLSFGIHEVDEVVLLHKIFFGLNTLQKCFWVCSTILSLKAVSILVPSLLEKVERQAQWFIGLHFARNVTDIETFELHRSCTSFSNTLNRMILSTLRFS
jgi:hypothetical protein